MNLVWEVVYAFPDGKKRRKSFRDVVEFNDFMKRLQTEATYWDGITDASVSLKLEADKVSHLSFEGGER